MDDTPDRGAAARSQLSGLPWYLRPPDNTMALIANEGPEKERTRISGDLLRHPTRRSSRFGWKGSPKEGGKRRHE